MTSRRQWQWIIFGFLMALLLQVSPAQAASLPSVAATSWIIMDADSGKVLAEQASHERRAMASLTKLMTALVAVERGNLDQVVTITPGDVVGESSMGLVPGQRVTLRTLLYGLLLRSGNDAAMAIARAVGGSPDQDSALARQQFVDWMNARAASLGMTDTQYMNPHGLDTDGHYSSAYDLALLARAVLNNPTLVIIFGTLRYSAEGFTLQNTNQLLGSYPGLIGGKTGWTDNAGRCLVLVAERAGKREIVVLLHSTDDAWFADGAALLNAGWLLLDPITTPERAAALFAWWHDRVDGPVAAGLEHRTWLWGNPISGVVSEPYQESPGGDRLVQYFDKGRMELTHPDQPIDARWAITGGRLAWEMITGQRQIGDSQFIALGPAAIPVAGDAVAGSPTYATLRPLLSAPAPSPGSVVTQVLTANGTVTDDPRLAAYNVHAGAPDPATGHGIADVFASFTAQWGLVQVAGHVRSEPLLNPPVALLGLPITNPYWVRVPVGGRVHDVLIQCFERRCLTYTPDNPPGWQVEMGNIGQHYLHWLQAATLSSVLWLAQEPRNVSYGFGILLDA